MPKKISVEGLEGAADQSKQKRFKGQRWRMERQIFLRIYCCKSYLSISVWGYSITTWTRFWPFLTSSPLRWTKRDIFATSYLCQFGHHRQLTTPLILSTWLLDAPFSEKPLFICIKIHDAGSSICLHWLAKRVRRNEVERLNFRWEDKVLKKKPDLILYSFQVLSSKCHEDTIFWVQEFFGSKLHQIQKSAGDFFYLDFNFNS